jgi:hypothetical protein
VDEIEGLEDRAVDVGLGGEVEDRLAALGGLGNRLGVGDVALHEAVLDPLEVGRVTRVGQLVEHDDVHALRCEAPDEVRADEARAAGDENRHRREAYRLLTRSL